MPSTRKKSHPELDSRLLILIYPWILLAPTRKIEFLNLPPTYNIETHPCFPQLGESLKSAPSSLVGTFFYYSFYVLHARYLLPLSSPTW